MPLVSPLPATEQAVLIWSFLGSPHNFPVDDARKLVERLVPGDERSVARQLKVLLVEYGQKVKHVHCLELAAKLAGRRGWHDGLPKPAFEAYFANFSGLEQGEGKYARFSDLAEYLAKVLQNHVQQQRTVFVASIHRGQQGLILQVPSSSAVPALAVINLLDSDASVAWNEGVPMLLERLRRIIEESAAPGFLDGFFCAYHGNVGKKHCGQLTVHEGGFEIGGGNELHAFQAIERAENGDFTNAVAEHNTLRTRLGTYYLSYVYSEFEPRMEMSKRTLFHPESAELLRRYQRVKQRSPGLLATLLHNAPLAYSPTNGIPETVSMNLRTLDARLSELGQSRGQLATEAGITEVALNWPLEIGAFIQVAKHLNAKDYNELVAIPPYAEAKPADEADFLQTVLNGVEDVRFVLRKGIPDEAVHEVREACSDLAASRRLLMMNRGGLIEGGLDEVVFSTDADEFLSAIHAVGCSARVIVVPAFLHAEELQEVPGVGRRAMVYVASA